MTIRLDAGAGSLHALARYHLPWTRLDCQVISHFHIDHAGELPALLFAMKYGRESPRDKPLVLVGPVGLCSLLKGVDQAFQRRLREQEFPLEIRELEPGGETEIGGVRLLVAKSNHTPESLAIRVEAAGRSLGYTGDTAPSEALVDFFQGVDLLISECSLLEKDGRTAHMCANDVADLAARAGVGHLVPSHFYFDPVKAGLEQILRKRYDGSITLARDGLALEVVPAGEGDAG